MCGARCDVALEVDYAYSAYGETAVLGPDGGNALRYTGREDDGNGLFYYRARYYDPVLKRFVSEDPIGLEAGPNFYAYVNGDPVSFIDPLGLATLSVGVRGSFFYGGAGGTVGGSFGFSTCGQVCVQIQTCGRLGAGASIGAGATVSTGSGNFRPGTSLGGGGFGNVGIGPFGGFSTNTTTAGTTGTLTVGGGVGVAVGVQTCVTKTVCLRDSP
jgi:RHS repeat-associated protein